MDQLGANPLIHVSIKIEENMNRQITLCQEHVLTIELQVHTNAY
jgi:hypothetical protein